MTIDELKEHCEKYIDPNNKIIFDKSSRTYQEHKLILDIIEELKAIKKWKSEIISEFAKYDATCTDEIYQQGRADAIEDVMNLDIYKFGVTMLTAEEYIKVSDIKQLKDSK